MGNRHHHKVVGAAVAVIVALGMVLPVGVSNHNSDEPVIPLADPSVKPAYVPHDPIRIDSNADFAAQGFNGSGTEADPWVIENLEINGTGQGYCIYVGNTTDYFIITGCDLKGANGTDFYNVSKWPYFWNSAIILNNVMNATIKSNPQISNNEISGILCFNSSLITIKENIIYNNLRYGIYASCCNYIMGMNNTLFNNTYDGIVNIHANNNQYSNNKIFYNSCGIYIQQSNNNTIDNNLIHDNQGGIGIHYSKEMSIINNVIENNIQIGIDIDSGHTKSGESESLEYPYRKNRIIGNNIMNSSTGLSIFLTGVNGTRGLESYDINYSEYDNIIYWNNFINNTCQAIQDGINLWDNGYPDGGNHWSDYNGTDQMSGPSQNISGSDGIGDEPYANIADYFSGGNTDRYPLMAPFNYSEFNILLQQGWNLISLPVRQLNDSIDSVLESITGKWDYLQTYEAWDVSDPWKTYSIHKPDVLNDLNSMNHQRAYWVNVTKPNVTLTVVGDLFGYPVQITLYAGWNLVGYPSLTNETVGNALWGTGADRVEVFDALAPYRINEVGPTYLLKPGEGYWVHVPSDTVWTINW